jgi:putative intracellular protease/amidase/YHS domain-containing protein
MKTVPRILCVFAILSLLTLGPASRSGPEAGPPAQPEVAALKGLDPVALVKGKEVPGDPKLVARRGRFLYRFANDENKAEFEARPKQYEIQLRGQCGLYPGMMGDPAVFAVVDGRIYLAGSDQCLETFRQSPAKYLKQYAGRRKVAILVFEGVQIIDYTGPYEVFGQARYDVFTVAENPQALTTSMGMTIVPTCTFADCPRPDIVVLPGGSVRRHLDSPAVLRWVKQSAEPATCVLSVCNGAFFLARAGLLDGLTATTFHGLLDDLQKEAPGCRVVCDRRFVDNGKIVTAAGLSSGIDGALHVIEKLEGKGQAQQTALGLEYNWQPEAGYARAKFADMHLRRVLGRGFELPEGATWKVHSTKGDAEHWQKVWEIHMDGSGADLLRLIDSKLSQSWSKAGTGAPAGDLASQWQFTDKQGAAWKAACRVEPMSGEQGGLRLVIRIDRASESAAPKKG